MCLCETGRLTLHSTSALPLNFSSLKVQFVHNLAVNDCSFVRQVCFSAVAGCVCVSMVLSRDIAHVVRLVDRSPLDSKVM